MSREKGPSPKAEALKAIADVVSVLAADVPLGIRLRFELRATLEYAATQVGEISELKRKAPSAKQATA